MPTPALFEKRPGGSWGRKLWHPGWRPLYGVEDVEDTGRYGDDDVWGEGQFGPPNMVHPGAVAQHGAFRHGFAMPGYMARESDEFPNLGPRDRRTGRRVPIIASMGAMEDESPYLLYDPMEYRQRFGSRMYVQMRPSAFGDLGLGAIRIPRHVRKKLRQSTAEASAHAREFDAAWGKLPAKWRAAYRTLMKPWLEKSTTCVARCAGPLRHRLAAYVAWLEHAKRRAAPAGAAGFAQWLVEFTPRQAAKKVQGSASRFPSRLCAIACDSWTKTMRAQGVSGLGADEGPLLPKWAIPVGMIGAGLLAWRFFKRARSSAPAYLPLENPRRARARRAR